uniref:DNA-directed RNA polymerase subunit beta' n=1 Tax=Helicosporidium sp. subsp. Simulium jonesii TaxID=145475 RepID=RPOC1_HELSJ|nr:PEP RNA polymerase beta' subunit [Helicosporidium sp. ex Simulium jonesi]Q2EEW9.1 RecName: Full=DNA-directed RNA polymerase subunit beta'; Short=RNAP subunit gamma; AltName: Full=RNA polymerase subunit gamma; AltName: Full=Transcriptase subunit gamma [Helicosporidium sp. ex Simulium jonesi]ABD33973.1 RNA polymerase beta' chain [Helicosporidium sp. ex Simulium jonesi]
MKYFIIRSLINKSKNFYNTIIKYNKTKLFALELSIISPQEIQNSAEYKREDGSIVGKVEDSTFYDLEKVNNKNLFSQQIFGPLIDFTCACGKKLNRKNKEINVCTKCGIEFLPSSIRSKRKGYIKLNYAMLHPFYIDYCEKLLMKSKKSLHLLLNMDSFFYFPSYKNWVNFLSEKNHIYLFLLKKILIYNRYSYIYKYSTFFKNRSKFPNNKKMNKLFFYNALGFYGLNSRKTWTVLDFIKGYNFFLGNFSKYYKKLSWYAYQQKISLNKYKSNNISINNFIDNTFNFYKNEVNSLCFKVGGDGIEMFFLQDMAVYSIINKFLKLRVLKLNNLINVNNKYYGKINTIIQNSKNYQYYFKHFYLKKIAPVWMTLRRIPVLPPNLRPILDLSGKNYQKTASSGTLLFMRDIMHEGNLFISDINTFYREIIIHNKKAFNFFSSLPTLYYLNELNIEYVNSKLWLLKYYLMPIQKSITSLFDKNPETINNFSNKKFTDLILDNVKPTSILDSLKGKYGKIRFNLLGKRVDYSGRSVIISAPHLKIYECGIPYEMALTLYYPFLSEYFYKKNNNILKKNYNKSELVLYSKSLIFTKSLQSILLSHPIIINRAPTLHRLGIQSFLPKLTHSKAIELHPLVCPAFNADFDGDQMAIHVPITEIAKLEAIQLMASSLFVYAPASGLPLLIPTQDIILGFNFYTNDLLLKTSREDKSIKQAMNQGFINECHIPYWIKINTKDIFFKFLAYPLRNYIIPIELQLNIKGFSKIIRLNTFKVTNLVFDSLDLLIKKNYISNWLILNNTKFKYLLISFLQNKNLLTNKQVYLRTTLGNIYFNKYLNL